MGFDTGYSSSFQESKFSVKRKKMPLLTTFSRKKWLLVLLSFLLINAVYYFFGVWGLLIDTITYSFDDGTNLGGSLAWGAFFLTAVGIGSISLLAANLIRDRKRSWIICAFFIAAPVIFFLFSPLHAVCYEDNECRWADYACCQRCGVSTTQAVNRNYFQFRKRLLFCSLIRKFCPMIECEGEPIRFMPICESKSCRIERITE